MEETIKPKLTRTPKPRKPRQSSVKLGAKAAARTQARRRTKDVVGSKISNPLLTVVAVAALGALASYFINKQ